MSTSTQPTQSNNRFPRIRLTNWQIILIVLVMVGGRLVIDFSQRIIEGQQKLEEQRLLETELARLRAEHIELEIAKTYYSSPAFIEAWAHDEGKMIREGEVLVVPEYGDPSVTSPTQPADDASIDITQVPPWQVWWALFFDAAPAQLNQSNTP